MAPAAVRRGARPRAAAAALASVGLVASGVLAAGAEQCAGNAGLDKFDETLHLRPLAYTTSQPLFLARFDFRVEASISPEFRADQFDLLPRSVGKLLNAHRSLEAFEASLTRGRWKEEEWGPAPLEFRPPGAVVTAAIKPEESSDEATLVWKFLISSLSGSLCASFEGMDPDLGEASSRGRPLAVPWATNGSQLRFATLPYEPVCTENLTPWTKLLPCGRHAGLAKLIAPMSVAASPLVSLSLRVTVEDSKVVMQAFLDAVLPMERGTSDFPAWFGAREVIPCPASSTSTVQLWTGAEPDVGAFDADEPVLVTPLGDSAGFSLRLGAQDFVRLPKSAGFSPPGATGPAPWTAAGAASRRSTGSHDLTVMRDMLSQEGKSERTHGRYLLRFSNFGSQSQRRALFMDQLPFFIRPLWHTFRATVEGPAGELEELVGLAAMRRLELQFVSSDGGKLPTEVFLSVDVPAAGTVNVFMDVMKNFVQLREFSHACEKGFDVGGAAWLEQGLANGSVAEARPEVSLRDFVASLNHTVGATRAQRVPWQLHFTEGLLVLVPMPDFSMPFNVIALTSTALTFFFGSLFRNLAAGHAPHWVLKKDNEKKPSRVRQLLRFLPMMAVAAAFWVAWASEKDILELRQKLPEQLAGPLVDGLLVLKPQLTALLS